VSSATRLDTELLELEEVLRAAEDFQQILVAQGRVPDVRKLLIRRTRRILDVIGGLLLGLMAATVGVIMTFIIFNMMLHI
jgi:hypothetical protein